MDGVEVLDVPLHVTIDEAGAESYAQYFDTGEKIRDIHAAIVTNGTFKFQEVHVTVTGTGLETTTAEIDSKVETIKFKMQPWTANNFEAMVDQSSHENKPCVKKVVREFSILEDLISNARCAYHVLCIMADVSFLDKSRVESFVNVIVSIVADLYIQQNGLTYLQAAKEKWMVARLVFLELDKASSQPGIAFFPEFKDLPSERIRSIGNSLLDVNVESVKGVKTLALGSTHAYSISPAITIVLAHLLNTEAAISWDWQAFESTVMLSELKQMIVGSQEAPSKLDKIILVLKSWVPEVEETISVTIPEMSRYTVMLNGPNSEYADVVAPYCLVQAKFTGDFTNPPKLDLQDELNKMGVTSSTKHALQQFMTRVFYTMWECREKVEAGIPSVVMQTGNKDPRFECYPYNTLSPRVAFAKPAVIVGKYDESTGWTVPESTFGQDGVCTAFHEQRPVTAVFATNGCEYRFVNSSFNIKPNDVDWKGKLKAREEELPADFQSILSTLLENVEIWFLFL